MKRIFIPLLFSILLPLTYSCTASKYGGYTLNEKDAANAVREMLEMGARDEVLSNSFTKETIMNALFPESVRKVLNTLDQLGLTNQIDRFTTTLSKASQETAANSIPIFVDAIHNMRIDDAMHIIKSGGSAATDYLRSTIGSDLRHSITPVMKSALDEYHLNDQWNEIIKPVKSIAGNKLNLDLANLMAGVVSEAMFQKIAEREQQIRTDASARSTTLLRKVFSKNWS